MRWTPGGRSRNLEDRRGARPARGRRTGGALRIPMPRGRGGRLGLGTTLVLLLLLWWLGADPSTLLGGLGSAELGVDAGGPLGGPQDPAGAPPFQSTPQEEEAVEFVSFVLDDVQSTWARLLPGYRDAKLVLFRDATRSACGVGQAEMGPFYCPGDQKVYIDLSFFRELRTRFGAPGDFAQAYVLAHEIGHHLQSLTGIEEALRREQRADPRGANAASVRMELQADCLAGVWGHDAARRDLLEPGDVEEGLGAAAAVGDDRIQQMSGRGVHPESFTHGSSAQRVQWLRRGLQSGAVDACGL